MKVYESEINKLRDGDDTLRILRDQDEGDLEGPNQTNLFPSLANSLLRNNLTCFQDEKSQLMQKYNEVETIFGVSCLEESNFFNSE